MMKTYKKIIYLICFTCFFSYSCQEYLDKTLKADVTETQVFSTFPTFQGFVEKMYCDIVDFATPRVGAVWNLGDDALGGYGGIINGDLWSAGGADAQFYAGSVTRTCTPSTTVRNHVWDNGWAAIRDCNIALKHINDLKDATNEEKNVILGQVYFFRGWFHWGIMKQWGRMPYSDTLFGPTDVMQIPQLTMFETGEKVLKDLQRAVDLLPVDWDATVVGQATLGNNRTRLTKGKALAVMSEVYLWLGSPLMNGAQTGSYTYGVDYCKKAAEYAWKVIQLADQGVYALDTWATYNDMFKTNNTTEAGRSKEVIFKAPFLGQGARWYMVWQVLPIIGGEGYYIAPTQNFIENFETITGLPIDDPASGFVPLDPWNNRDPRFRNSVTVDGDRICVSRSDATAFAQFYVGGRDKGGSSSVTGFGLKKFIFNTWNTYDAQWGGQAFMCVPILRLAEIYLIYAEAANEAYGGPSGKDPNANITALDAVNKIRNRAGMPGVNAKFLGSKEAFRDRIWNERTVELCFEAKRRDDLRRWHIATQDKYRDFYACDFPSDHTSFTRTYIKSIVFDSEKYYWFPFNPNQVLLYPGWKQNPGW